MNIEKLPGCLFIIYNNQLHGDHLYKCNKKCIGIIFSLLASMKRNYVYPGILLLLIIVFSLGHRQQQRYVRKVLSENQRLWNENRDLRKSSTNPGPYPNKSPITRNCSKE